MPETKIADYFFKQSSDGAVAVQVNAPCAGAVTITWKPTKEYPGKGAEIQMPHALFQAAIKEYAAEYGPNAGQRPTRR